MARQGASGDPLPGRRPPRRNVTGNRSRRTGPPPASGYSPAQIGTVIACG